MNTGNQAFSDDRINIARGRVMRAEVCFLTVVSALYTLIYTGGLLCAGVFRWYHLITELAVLAVGMALVTWGELGYTDARRDEMVAARQGRFYDHAFGGLVCVAALAYCLHVAVSLRVPQASGILPVGFFPSVLLQLGGLFLLFGLKGKRVTFNYTVMDAPMGAYWRRVLWNVLRLCGFCLLFGGVAVLLYLFLGGRDLWEMLGICLAAFLTGLLLGVDYLALSAAERVSDRAEQRGRLSAVLPVTFFGYAVCSVVPLAMSIVALGAFGGVQSARGAVLISYANLAAGTLGSIMIACLALYLVAECRNLPAPCGRRLERAGRRYALLAIASLVITALQSHVGLYINGLEDLLPEPDGIRRMVEAIVAERQIVGTGLFLLGVFCLLDGLGALVTSRVLPRRVTVPVAVLTVAAEGLRLLLRAIAILFPLTVFAMAERVVGLLLCALLGGFLLWFCRTVRMEVEE